MTSVSYVDICNEKWVKFYLKKIREGINKQIEKEIVYISLGSFFETNLTYMFKKAKLQLKKRTLSVS